MSGIFGQAPILPGSGDIQQQALAGLNTAVPGFSNLSASASKNIGDLLTGLPSTAPSRLKNAWYGAGTGLNPQSDFINNRGYDLYQMNAANYRQQGLEDLLKTVGTVSGTAALTPGQIQEQGNSQAVYAAAPDPTAANNYALDLFNKYLRPSQPWDSGRITTTRSIPGLGSNLGGFGFGGSTIS